jgi:hypothetical protein
MRPVWARRQRRAYLNLGVPGPPSEEEKQDAIRVLEDPRNQIYAPSLYREAERILGES